MSKITNDGLTPPGIGCFCNHSCTHMATVGVKELRPTDYSCRIELDDLNRNRNNTFVQRVSINAATATYEY